MQFHARVVFASTNQHVNHWQRSLSNGAAKWCLEREVTVVSGVNGRKEIAQRANLGPEAFDQRYPNTTGKITTTTAAQIEYTGR